MQRDRGDRAPGLMPTPAAGHHQEGLARIVFGPSRPPRWGFMGAAIYHASIGKSVHCGLAAQSAKCAKADLDQVTVTIRDFMSTRPSVMGRMKSSPPNDRHVA